jgi:methyl-accepting chemotaxis protein
MNYKETIRKKNKLLALALMGSIILRTIANAPFVGIGAALPMGVGAIVIGVLLYFLSSKVPPVPMMFIFSVFMSVLVFLLMTFWPCKVNFMMTFMTLFFVIIYEDIRVITLQTVCCIAEMIYFHFKYYDWLNMEWGNDTTVIAIVYLISGMIVFIMLSRLTKKQFDEIERTSKVAQEEKEKAEKLLAEIGKSVGVLDTTSGKISESVTISGDITNEIAKATEDVARRANSEVEAADTIKTMVIDGVENIKSVSEASIKMTEASNETNQAIANSDSRVKILSERMDNLNAKMDEIATAIAELSDENDKIVGILGTLGEITDQTNLLSLNASIEAARAGEAGKGFAVVADEIRNLSDSSAQFTDEIHAILDGVEAKTKQVRDEISMGQESVQECNEYVKEVGESFEIVTANSDEILNKSQDIENQSNELQSLLNQTLDNVNEISGNVESTSAAMEEISASINNLNGSIGNVVSGYNDINDITASLVEVSEQ